MAAKVSFKELRRFLTNNVGTSMTEARGYVRGFQDAGITTQEQADSLLSHLRTKYKQGSINGEHSDAGLDEAVYKALGVTPFKNAGTGLGERVYGAGQYHGSLGFSITPASSTKRLQQYKQNRVTRSLQNSLKADRDEYYSRQAKAQKNIQQDTLIRKLEGQRQYFENSHYSTSAEAAVQANIEESSQRAINKQLTGSQEKVGISGNIAAAREEEVIRNNDQLQEILRNREIGEKQFQNYQNLRNQRQVSSEAEAAAANVEPSGVSKATQDIYDNLRAMGETKQYDEAVEQFFKDPMAARIAEENNIEKNAAGMKRVAGIVNATENAGPVQQMFASGGQTPLGVGSRKTLQEGTVSYPNAPRSELENSSGISDLGFGGYDEASNMRLAQRELSIDEAKLRGLIKQNDMPGTKAANDMMVEREKKGLQSNYDNIMKSDLSNEEKVTKWNTAREEAIERLKNGATISDYFFGNRVHHGLVGMAAITGTMGVAFGGHKSNAELYSSPF